MMGRSIETVNMTRKPYHCRHLTCPMWAMQDVGSKKLDILHVTSQCEGAMNKFQHLKKKCFNLPTQPPKRKIYEK